MSELCPLKVEDKIDNFTTAKDPIVPSKEVVDQNQNPQEEQTNEEKNQNDDQAEEQTEKNLNEDPIFFAAKVNLPLIDINTMEDDEDVIVELRARIYRYDTSEDEPEFKERGTGVVKILRHKKTEKYRVLMRRDKTFKICANHYITSSMKLDKHNNSEKVFVYSTLADFYENQLNPETFAIRFSNAENAAAFKKGFEDAVLSMTNNEEESDSNKPPEDKSKTETELEIVSEMEKIKLNNK